MKRMVKTLAVVLVGAGLVAVAAAPAVCADEFCPMGGTQVKIDVVKDKAIEFGKDSRKAVVANEDAATWSVLTLSKSDNDIAILLSDAGVFFGVAGRGGNELSDRDIEKAFGKDLGRLKEAVKDGMRALWKADVVKLQGSDIEKIADAAGLGTVADNRGWALTTQDCKGMDLDASDLK
jgi:hypothetical protein